MKIRNEILIYFSSMVVALTAISLTLIYILFSEFREEEFQQQQNEKIKYTIGLIAEFKQMSEELAVLMDAQDIHDFYDEKLLIFDGQKELIFSSIDDLTIEKQNEILNQLSSSKRWIETKEEDYDLIGVYIESKGKTYYAVSKAYDAFGYSKMYFLRNVLIGIFITISAIVILVSLYLSNVISKPITALAEKLSKIDLAGENIPEVQMNPTSYELKLLTGRFNELLRRTNMAFSYQKHTVWHISHQLKTPTAVLVSELEKLRSYTDIEKIKFEIDNQVNNAKSLGSIINVLLEISKIETGQQSEKEKIRIDELIFDVIDELSIVYPDFNFDVNYFPDEIDERKLHLKVNTLLIKQAFLNLLTNCISYSDNSKAMIKIDCSLADGLKISIINTWLPLSKEEEKRLFSAFFRGENSRDKTGFGLGLVLTKRIFTIYSATIAYSNPSDNLNVFEVRFPLN